MNQKMKVVSFLLANGWIGGDPESAQQLETFVNKQSDIVVSLYNGQMFLTDKTGDHIEKKIDYHSLLGALADFKQLPIDFNRV